MIVRCRRNIGVGIAGAKPLGAKGDGTLPGNVALTKLDCRGITPCNTGAALDFDAEVPQKVAPPVYICVGRSPAVGRARLAMTG